MDKMKFETKDMTVRNIDKIAELFPNCITETADTHMGETVRKQRNRQNDNKMRKKRKKRRKKGKKVI